MVKLVESKWAIIPLLAGALALGGVAPIAVADEELDLSPIEAIELITPEVFEGSAETSVSVSDESAVEVLDEASGLSVSVPADAEDGILLDGKEGFELRIDLPNASEAGDAEEVSDGIVAFDNGDGSSTVPIVKDGGSVQIITVIEGPDSPTRYEYEFSLPEGGAMAVTESGAVLITDRNGDYAAAVAPAWATDADGNAVPTHYEVSGSTLTQVVDISADTAYPVVADPWAGIQLFTGFKRDWYKGDRRYSAWVTPLGAVVLGGGGGVGGYAAGQLVFRGAGWDEWKTVWPAITNKATLQQQYNCHVAASLYGLPFTRDYNLERIRANRSNWVDNVWNHQCNW